jgi:hypothetical protein
VAVGWVTAVASWVGVGVAAAGLVRAGDGSGVENNAVIVRLGVGKGGSVGTGLVCRVHPTTKIKTESQNGKNLNTFLISSSWDPGSGVRVQI